MAGRTLQSTVAGYGRAALIICQVKGNKDRAVPIGERALSWLAAYRDEVRPGLVAGRDCMTLFLSRDGHPLDPKRLSETSASPVPVISCATLPRR